MRGDFEKHGEGVAVAAFLARLAGASLIGFADLREELTMRRILIALGLCLAMQVQGVGQTPHRVAIRAGKLIDGKSDKPVENALIVIEGDKIVSVTAGGSAPAGRKA